MKEIYLDNGATTSVDKRVVKAMLPFLSKEYGNPSSPHVLGEKARAKLEESKKTIASKIGAKPWELIMTSGATEANNLALFGLAKANMNKKKIIISAIEHSSIYEPAMQLKKWGYTITIVPVNSKGEIDIRFLEREINGNTLLVSVIHGHNELGVLQDLASIGELCKKKGVLFHTDAVQSFCKEDIDVRKLGIDLLSASSHKIFGPKGSGFLYVKEGTKIEPIIFGGSQERGMRGGSENLAGVIGFAKATEIANNSSWVRVAKLRDHFMRELEKIGGRINGSRKNRLANNIHVSFPNCDGEMLVERLSQQGIYCSTRSACIDKQEKDNRILDSIGLSSKEKKGSLRFVLSPVIKKKDLDYVLRVLKKFI